MQVSEIVTTGLSANEWFSLAGQLAMLGWIILIFLPRRIKPLFFIAQYAIPFSLSLLYAGLALSQYFINDGDYNSLSGVRALFSNDYMLLAGWVHYLAFDLFIGAWIAQYADQLGMSRMIQAPIFLATFMFGPVGLILFFITRTGFLNGTTPMEADTPKIGEAVDESETPNRAGVVLEGAQHV